MSITEDTSSVSKMPRNTNRGGRLIEYAQLHGIASHWTPASRSGIAVVPISPRGGIVRQALTGDVAQCLINPFARHHRSERSEEHTSELQSRLQIVCGLLLEKKKERRNFTHRVHLIIAGGRCILLDVIIKAT